MKRLLLNSAAATALAICSTATAVAGNATYGAPKLAPANDNSRLLVAVKEFGDYLGVIPKDVVSKVTYYYYNTNGKPVGDVKLGRLLINGGQGGYSDAFEATTIHKYVFDSNGNTTNINQYDWSLSDFEDYYWKSSRYNESYVYNEQGQLTSDTLSAYYDDYTYYEDGTLKTKSIFNKYSKTLTQQITYSDYDENGNPLHYSSTGAYDSYIYEADLTYDENGNKISELQYKLIDDPEFPDQKKRKSVQIEEWTYQDGMLALDLKSTFDNDGNETPMTKVEYVPVDGNWNEVDRSEYSMFGTEWLRGTYARYEYANYSGMEEKTSTQLTAEVDKEAINTVNLSFPIPQLGMSQQCKFVIYRDNVAIDTVGVADIFDPYKNVCFYQDKDLKNGTYTYFVQPMFGSGGDPFFGGTMTWNSYYSTMPVDVTVHTDLPKVSNFKLAGAHVVEGGTFIDPSYTYYAEFSWENPDDMEKYGFEKNSLYFTGDRLAETDTTDVNANNMSIAVYRNVNAFLVTNYKYGRVLSDTITVNYADLKDIATGIGSVTVKGATNLTFNGNEISLSDNANISVFATSGQKVAAKRNTNSLSLANLPAATYIICVEKNGKVSAYKYNVK